MVGFPFRIDRHSWAQSVLCQSPESPLLSDPAPLSEKSPRYLPQFSQKSIFSPELQNRAKHLPQLLNPFILPP